MIEIFRHNRLFKVQRKGFLPNGNRKEKSKLASLEATLVETMTHPPTHSLTGVKCRATSVAKNSILSDVKTMNFESVLLCSEYNWDKDENKESLDI